MAATRPLLLNAGAAALVLAPSLVRRPVTLPRLMAEAFGSTLAVVSFPRL